MNDTTTGREGTMGIQTISIQGTLHTNELAPITEPICGDDGLAEVEVVDVNDVTLHLRHYTDEQACLSLSMTRAEALALAEVLRAAAAEAA